MATTPPSTPKKPRRYLLARHGETNFNKEKRVQGTLDTSVLTLEGISQAAALGVYISGRQDGKAKEEEDGSSIEPSLPITRTWCSPMTRCRQTYAAISGGCTSSSSYGHPLPNPTIHADLREIELREWQGRLRQEIIEQDSDNWNTFKKDPRLLRLDGGLFAPVLDCWERGLSNWNVIRSDAAAAAKLESTNDSEDEESAVVFTMCHGAIGQCMLLQALGIDIEMYGKSRRYSFDNCECIEIEWADGEECSTRWRRVHPVVTKWLSTSASQMMDSSGGLSCGR
mmetsp:Transcript_14747/g.26761  ORF Transcript_14747/g.26761 Transcript_14747/m.26761 type:complete len:283 (+) Transcript_14747:138-986(+)|eukprot:CAMPEP_0202026458 /NCGR_PEP_ID=MMETSP0905-20130828/58936_1 /ASSEMBLY_ACC=CAM_ASM_000554 /TAXON_ID=420261 /ORGANISM="Thalassiosira antarctica, Strain CCMP982" /LENGTH=282 /DNA_ID=CAMNT_0048589679 /DNA_START=33 /DNA_END=881 /DNA_ORIENTATION=+